MEYGKTDFPALVKRTTIIFLFAGFTRFFSADKANFMAYPLYFSFRSFFFFLNLFLSFRSESQLFLRNSQVFVKLLLTLGKIDDSINFSIGPTDSTECSLYFVICFTLVVAFCTRYTLAYQVILSTV